MEGIYRVAAATPTIRVADCIYNREQLEKEIDYAIEQGVQILVLPELCITGYTCSDLLEQKTLLKSAREQIIQLSFYTENKKILVLAGFPMEWNGNLYNTAAVMGNGQLLGLIPKINIPNYSEFYEMRYFTPGFYSPIWINFNGESDQWRVPFGANILFQCEDLLLGVEICEDLWVASPPSISHALSGATVIANLSASNETTGKDPYRYNLVNGQSARLICGYIYADAGEGESTTDLVFSGHNLISENGTILSEAKRFCNEMAVTDLDIERILCERRRMTTFQTSKPENYAIVPIPFIKREIKTTLRQIDPTPFVPRNILSRSKRCEEIFMIQVMGLKKRLAHTNIKNAVLGISGGLDSTLALLVTAKAFDLLSFPRSQIHAITMPCFGTTNRTYQNAIELIKRLGVSLHEINIRKAVNQHFDDIGQNPKCYDVTYENAQARERTQVLMDYANRINALVVGTGDMSELALGWATYNGDHMSMYGVNASVPKTLVRYLVDYYAEYCGDQELLGVLQDILDTPVSPELLPPENGVISQKTEDIVGPYELHDFYLFYMLRYGFSPKKIFELAVIAFGGQYQKEVIMKWLKTFYRRFFSQQFKRSCLPDGPKVGSVAISPRGDLRMPSDACVRIWMDELDQINLMDY